MSTAVSIFITLAGVSIIVVVLRDVLHELFHPSGTGTIARTLMHAFWRVFRALGRRHRSVLGLAGPVILVGVLAAWTLLLAVGWALVYWPGLPDEFRFSSPLAPATQAGFGTALYVSLLSLSTLGFGDVTPTSPALRLGATLEGFVGFALLTAGISWILMLYPVLRRRHALAQRIVLHGAAARRTGIGIMERDPAEVSRVLDELAASLITARVDLMLSSISYYFRDPERGVSLPASLPELMRIADVPDDANPTVRYSAVVLRVAIDAFADLVGAKYLGLRKAPTMAILSAYADDHQSGEGRTAPTR
ncbi:MAG TPA: potassium channel family protein [Gemmatimonadaceae bacterium]